MKCTAIIQAAGQGKRMKSNVQKQFLQLGEYPVLYYSLKAFQDSPEITDIVLVCGKTEINYCKDAFVQKYHIDKVSEVVAGGKERYESVYQGLCACHKTDYVLIHDGARPFVTEELIQRGLDCAKEYQACAAGVPSKDTVKIIGEGKKVRTITDKRGQKMAFMTVGDDTDTIDLVIFSRLYSQVMSIILNSKGKYVIFDGEIDKNSVKVEHIEVKE